MITAKSFLTKYINIDKYTKEELFECFSKHICEVEKIVEFGSFKNLVSGQILSIKKHENSNHLNILEIDVKTSVLQIVCGAKNVMVGKKVIVALVGAKLNDLEIKETEIRGVKSYGMCCSLDELGINNELIEDKYKDGIYYLADDFELGVDLVEYFKLNDLIIHLDLTSNRSDLLSTYGIAYDLAAMLNLKVKEEKYTYKQSRNIFKMNIDIKTKLCKNYNLALINGIEVKESSDLIKFMLFKYNIKPINNIVDITNLAMYELGIPSHAYDFDKIGDNIEVSLSNNEEVILLDNKKYKLDNESIVIKSNNKIISLAGVMGLDESKITTDTKNILIECAYFDPVAIRKTASKLNIKSDSKVRFERRVNVDNTKYVLEYISSLITNDCGFVNSDIISKINVKSEKNIIETNLNKLNKTLGTTFKIDEYLDILSRYKFKYKVFDTNVFVEVPNRRTDIYSNRQEIYEEVSRLIGYDNIKIKSDKQIMVGGLTAYQKNIKMIENTLSSMGLNQVITYSLIDKKRVYDFLIEDNLEVDVMLPLTQERQTLRRSLITSLIDVYLYNKNRNQKDVFIYEISKVYSKEIEDEKLSILISGDFINNKFKNENIKSSFFLLKGFIEQIAANLNIELKLKQAILKNMHKTKTANIFINDKLIGFIGEVSPSYQLKNDLDSLYVCEINLKLLLENSNKTNYKILSKYPSITRDLALIVKDDIPSSIIENIIKKVSKDIIKEVNLFDEYYGKNVEEGYKSLAYSIVFQDNNKTLESVDVDNLVKKILSSLEHQYDIKLRI